MIGEIERVAEQLAKWLDRHHYETQSEVVGGMGSLRILSNDHFVVAINNDRGTLSVTLGRQPVVKDEDHHAIVYWALCLGIRVVHGEIPPGCVLSDRERLEMAQEEAATTEAVLVKLDSLTKPLFAKVEFCARRRQEALWRDMGLWPLPRDGEVRLRKSERDGPSHRS